MNDLLDAFDRLTTDEQRMAAAEILRRIVPPEYAPLDDETLGRLAEEVFLELDAQEAAD